MAIALTARQQEVLAFMRSFLAKNDQLPSMQAIADHFGFKSPNSAQDYANALCRKGCIERNALGNWRFVRTGKAVPA